MFTTIPLTQYEILNYFFSFPIYTMVVLIPFLALLDLFKKI